MCESRSADPGKADELGCPLSPKQIVLLFTNLLSELFSACLPVCKCNGSLEHCFEDYMISVKLRLKEDTGQVRGMVERTVCVCLRQF